MVETLIIFGGEYLIYLSAGAALLTIGLSRKLDTRQGAVALLCSLLFAFAIAALASALYSHPQPFAINGFKPLIPHEVDNAFPSHHTLLAATLGAFLAFRHRLIGCTLLIVAALIGVSRIAAGLHTPIDVIASLVFGTFAAVAGHLLVSRTKSAWYTKKNPDNVARHE